ncbi:MAG: class I SAM-dependent methyltransferase [Patescibacteria group bacterium]
MTKLHLGCGEIYFDGYINIDFPSKNHTVQTKSVADKYADITKLKFKNDSINEVRLHHVFEHFSRAQAIALLLSWRSWLTKDGIVRVEVPDFNRCAKVVLSPFSKLRQKNVALRHIFGSQEQFWAIHFDGYSKNNLKELFNDCGFDVLKINETKYKDTCNVEIIAQKNNNKITKTTAIKIATKYLETYLVDNSPTEVRLLKTWLKDFKKQLNQTWAK